MARRSRDGSLVLREAAAVAASPGVCARAGAPMAANHSPLPPPPRPPRRPHAPVHTLATDTPARPRPLSSSPMADAGAMAAPPADDAAVGAPVRAKFLAFLQKFVLDDAAGGGTTATSDASVARAGRGSRRSGGASAAPSPHYAAVLAAMVDAQETTIPVEWAHLEAHDGALADAVRDDHLRLDPFLRAAAADFVGAHAPEYAVNEVRGRGGVGGVGEGRIGLSPHRGRLPPRSARRPPPPPDPPPPQDDKPREFWVAFHALPAVLPLRALRADRVGRLSAFAGTVTRASEVRPEMALGAFKCGECGTEIVGVEQHYK